MISHHWLWPLRLKLQWELSHRVTNPRASLCIRLMLVLSLSACWKFTMDLLVFVGVCWERDGSRWYHTVTSEAACIIFSWLWCLTSSQVSCIFVESCRLLLNNVIYEIMPIWEMLFSEYLAIISKSWSNTALWRIVYLPVTKEEFSIRNVNFPFIFVMLCCVSNKVLIGLEFFWGGMLRIEFETSWPQKFKADSMSINYITTLPDGLWCLVRISLMFSSDELKMSLIYDTRV